MSGRLVQLGLLWVVGLLGLVLGCRLGLGELVLPVNVITHELRLLDFESQSNGSAVSMSTFALPTVEVSVSRYERCASEVPRGNCAQILRELLQQRPADGRLWLEYSKAIALEGDSDITADEALLHSYETAARESWVMLPRMAFALSVWGGLKDEVKAVAESEIRDRLDNDSVLNLLVARYLQQPFARASIQDVLSQATPQQKQSFILKAQGQMEKMAR